MDLFAQAEHDELAQSILLCTEADFIERVAESIDRLLPQMPRRETIAASLSNRGALIHVESLAQACAIADRIAPEHLALREDAPRRGRTRRRRALGDRYRSGRAPPGARRLGRPLRGGSPLAGLSGEPAGARHTRSGLCRLRRPRRPARRPQAALAELVATYRDTAPKLAAWLEESVPEGLAVFALPVHHRRRMRTSHPLERAVQQELKRRTVKVRVFPGDDALERLVSAILVEIDEKWASDTKAYIKGECQDA
jgi:hypothetical protein